MSYTSYNIRVVFSKYLLDKYNAWRGERYGKSVSIAAYAREIGIKQQILDAWMKGQYEPKDAKSIRVLADYFGPEIFDVLEIDAGSWGLELLPDPLRELAEKVIHTLVSRKVTPGSSDAKEIAREILDQETKKRKL